MADNPDDKSFNYWKAIFHGRLSAEEAVNRLIQFNIRGAFLVRFPKVPIQTLILSFLNKPQQVKHLVLPRRKSSSILCDLQSNKKEDIAFHVINSYEKLTVPVPIPLDISLIEDQTKDGLGDLCVACEQKVPSKGHLETHQLYKCKHCHKVMIVDVAYHHKIHCAENASREQFDCNMCDFKTYSKVTIKKHQDRGHNFECNQCESTYSLLVDLKQHKSTEHQRKFTCNICDKEFRTKRRCLEHMCNRKRLPRRARVYYKCEMCDFTTDNKRSLNRHKGGKHSRRRKRMSLTCEICEKSHKHHTSFKRHVAKCQKEQSGYLKDYSVVVSI